MNKNYIIAGLIGFSFIVGWNIFLTQRDEKMYDAYYRHKSIQILKDKPSRTIDYSPKQNYF